jgi:adenosylhomocysteine nucleosidase
MRPELAPIIREMSLHRDEIDGVTVQRGTVGAVDVVAVLTGIGMQPATRATEQLLGLRAIDHVMVVGIAGGVGPNVHLGDLIVPEVVVDGRDGTEYRPAPIDDSEPRGRIVSSDGLEVEPDEIDRLEREGVLALDMETGAVAAVCAQRGVAWSVYRGISDKAGDPAIDERLMGLSKPDGSANIPALLRYLATGPWRVRDLARLTRGMRAAADVAARAARRACEQHA